MLNHYLGVQAMNADPYDTFHRALAGNFALPDFLSPAACDCITQLLQVHLKPQTC